MRYCSTKCCTEQPTLPPEYECMWNDILQGYCNLYEHHNKVITNRKKIWEMAQPKHKKLKHCTTYSKCLGKPKYDIEIIDKTDKMESTRTEQLAYPSLRHLTTLTSHSSFSSFDDTRKSVVGRMMRKSLMSLYSHLHNITEAEKPPPPKLWSPKNKKKDTKHVPRYRHGGQAKKPEKVTKKNRYIIVIKPKKKRYQNLSKPKVYTVLDAKEWAFTDALKNYVPTARLLKLARPKRISINSTIPIMEEHRRLKALHYKASARIEDLAKCRNRRPTITTLKENSFKISQRALKTVASERINELAKPIVAVDIHTRTKPYIVSPNALKANASRRIAFLAQPKSR